MSNPIDLKIARVETFPVALPTLADFAVSGGSVARAGEPSIRVLVKVTADDGTFGWGEATPIPSWTYETLESITSTIDRYLAPVAIGIPVWDFDRLTRAFDRAINRGFSIGMPLAKAAIDVAVYDLLGKALPPFLELQFQDLKPSVSASMAMFSGRASHGVKLVASLIHTSGNSTCSRRPRG